MLADAEAFIYALPANRPVKFIMTSVDVIHSFYIPAFRMKRDVFPNRYSTLWVEPTSATHRYEGEGESETLIKIDEEQENFYLACTEYCGDQHSQMWGQIVVLKDPDYKKWLDKQGDTSGLTLIELAKLVRVQQGCNACHTVDGKPNTGPTWQNMFGSVSQYNDGSSVTIDDQAIRESIFTPAAKVRQGFTNQMPAYQGQINLRELTALIAYMQSISDNAPTSGLDRTWDDTAPADEQTNSEADEPIDGADAAPTGG